MSLLRVALRLILGINIGLHHTSRWTRMVWSGHPETVQQFHAAQLLENDATPILRRPDRPDPLSFRRHIDSRAREVGPGGCGPTGEDKTAEGVLYRWH